MDHFMVFSTLGGLIMRSSVIRMGCLSAFLLVLFVPGRPWADEDLTGWTLEALVCEKEYLETQIEYCSAGIEAWDALIAAMTGGKIGGDMPSNWEPYPEDMTEEQYAALLQVMEQYQAWLPGSYEEVINWVANRRELGDPEAKGSTYDPTLTNYAFDTWLESYVLWSNQCMDQLMMDEPFLAAIKAELTRRGAGGAARCVDIGKEPL
jgi:hypothetical protein